MWNVIRAMHRYVVAVGLRSQVHARVTYIIVAKHVDSRSLFFVVSFLYTRRTEDLNVQEWATTVLMGAAVLPLGVLMRFLPPSVEGDRNFAGYKPRHASCLFD